MDSSTISARGASPFEPAKLPRESFPVVWRNAEVFVRLIHYRFVRIMDWRKFVATFAVGRLSSFGSVVTPLLVFLAIQLTHD